MISKRSNIFQRKTARLAYFGVGSTHLQWDLEVQTLEPVVETALEYGVGVQLSSEHNLGQMKYSSLFFS